MLPWVEPVEGIREAAGFLRLAAAGPVRGRTRRPFRPPRPGDARSGAQPPRPPVHRPPGACAGAARRAVRRRRLGHQPGDGHLRDGTVGHGRRTGDDRGAGRGHRLGAGVVLRRRHPRWLAGQPHRAAHRTQRGAGRRVGARSGGRGGARPRSCWPTPTPTTASPARPASWASAATRWCAWGSTPGDGWTRRGWRRSWPGCGAEDRPRGGRGRLRLRHSDRRLRPPGRDRRRLRAPRGVAARGRRPRGRGRAQRAPSPPGGRAGARRQRRLGRPQDAVRARAVRLRAVPGQGPTASRRSARTRPTCSTRRLPGWRNTTAA